MNFATDLASGRIPGVSVDAATPALADSGRRLGSPEFQRR
jgi:hypothetical protein